MTDIYHVYPVNDLAEHDTESRDCPCGPRIEVQPNGSILVIHNAWDAREQMEYLESLKPEVLQ